MKKTITVIVALILTVLTLYFIFSNSTESQAVSAEKSNGVLEVIRPFLEIFVGKGNATDNLVRKLAHFAEFAVLGAEICVLSMEILEVKTRNIIAPLLFSLIAAMTDETIQYFFDRGSMVLDVWLDFSGAICGILFAFVILLLIKRKSFRN